MSENSQFLVILLLKVLTLKLCTLKYQIKVHVRSIDFGMFFSPVWPYSILYVYHFLTFSTQDNEDL